MKQEQYKNLNWEEYQTYMNDSEEIYLAVEEEEHRVGLVNHNVGVFTLRNGIDLGDFEIESDGEASYIDRATVDSQMLLATTKAIADEELGADLKESFILHYERLNMLLVEEESGEYGVENRPAIHLPSDLKLVGLVRQIKQARRMGDNDIAKTLANEFVNLAKKYMQAEPKPTGSKEMRQLVCKELGLEYEILDDEDRKWSEENLQESVAQSLDIKERPSLIQTGNDKAYQSIIQNLQQAEVELNKAHHLSSEELMAQTLRLIK